MVSSSYRLGIFGFPGASFLPADNLGLLDQRLAIEWIRDNIAGFGGDPKRIVIAGDSAGGASVDLYSYAWTKDPIVNGFIPMSGSAAAIPPIPYSKSNWYRLSEQLGCGSASDREKTAQCLRTIPGKGVMKAVEALSTSGPMGAIMLFGPVADNKICFSDYSSRSSAGNFIKRPMLVGNTDNERGLNTGMMGGMLKGTIARGGAMGLLATMGQAAISYISSSPLVIGLMPFMDSMSTCPTADAVEARRKNNVPAWRYRYFGEWENTNWFPGMVSERLP